MLLLSMIFVCVKVWAYPTSTNLAPSSEVMGGGEVRLEISTVSYGGFFVPGRSGIYSANSDGEGWSGGLTSIVTKARTVIAKPDGHSTQKSRFGTKPKADRLWRLESSMLGKA